MKHFHASINNLPLNDAGLVKTSRSSGGWQKDHRFHFLIDSSLYKKFKTAARLNKVSLSMMLNKILHEMSSLLDEYDTSVYPDLPFEDSKEKLDCKVHIRVQPCLMRKLEYLHFRFRTFSIATVLRRILRFYLVRCGGVLKYLKRKLKRTIRETRKFGVIKYFPMFTSDIKKSMPPDRIILMDSFNEIHAIRLRYPKRKVKIV